MDCLRLRNMVFFGHHGVSPAEKKVGQRIEVDVELHLDLAAAGAADDLGATVNYARVYDRVRRVVEERQFSLLEAIAEAIAGEILAGWKVPRIVVRVRKPNPPVGGIVDCAEVEVVRSPG
ncbi:MAG: dihydroneopterin aldolase [Firmicutes bacterium]|nr:dihydroneopterin aldolase [Bacillota bacterium]